MEKVINIIITYIDDEGDKNLKGQSIYIDALEINNIEIEIKESEDL